MKLYIVIGERENVYQDEIGGPFLPHPSKEIVSVFSTLEKAEKFITSNDFAMTATITIQIKRIICTRYSSI